MKDPSKNGRERILESTLDLVLRQGFAATTVDQILERTGLTKGAFFYHFKSKDELAPALMKRWVDLDLALLADVRSRAEKLSNDPLQQVLLMIGLVAEMFDGYQDTPPGCLITAFLYQEGALDEETRALAVRSFTSWRDVIAEKLRAAAAKRKPGLDFDFDSIADMFTAVLEGGFSMAKTYANPKPVAEQLRNYRLFVELLFAPPRRAGDRA